MAGASGSSAGSGSLGQTEAWMAYAMATCRRSDECAGRTDPDAYPCSSNCPDIMFAPGSTRTVDDLLECAAIYPTWPCADVAAERFPPCVTPGTRQVGEPCRFSSQCQSLECNLVGATCGTCARIATGTEDCTLPDVACAPGYLCT